MDWIKKLLGIGQSKPATKTTSTTGMTSGFSGGSSGGGGGGGGGSWTSPNSSGKSSSAQILGASTGGTQKAVTDNNPSSGGDPNYEQQLADAREQALNSLKARLGVINAEIDTGKAEAGVQRDKMGTQIGNTFGILQSGGWDTPTYNDISLGTGDVNSQFDLAKQKWYNPDIPTSLLSQLYNALATGKSNLGTERTNVTNLYGDENAGTGLLGAAKTSQQTQDTALNQNDIDTILKYSQAGGNARRATESAINKNRIRARAGGKLGSSFFDQLQGDTTNIGAKTISDIGTEEAGKRTDIAGKRTDLQNWLTQQLTSYKAEKALKGEAIDTKEIDMFNDMIARAEDVDSGAKKQYTSTAEDYTKVINEANKLKALNDINYGDMDAGIEQNYMTGLNNIQNYLQNKSLQEAAIKANAGGYNTGYDVYTPNSKGVAMTNLGTNTSVEDYIKNAQPGVDSLVYNNNYVNPSVDATNALSDTYNTMSAGLNTPTSNSSVMDQIMAMLNPNYKKKNSLEDYLNYGNLANTS